MTQDGFWAEGVPTWQKIGTVGALVLGAAASFALFLEGFADTMAAWQAEQLFGGYHYPALSGLALMVAGFSPPLILWLALVRLIRGPADHRTQ